MNLTVPGIHTDLDHLFGVWTAEDLAEFEANTAGFRVAEAAFWDIEPGISK